MPVEYPCTLLVDNGSYRAESTLSLRRLAAGLGEEIGHMVHPVSLLHSERVAPDELGGEPAVIFELFVRKQYAEHGTTSFLVVPLFFGHSAAIFEFLPQRLEVLREDMPDVELRLAPCLVDLGDPADTGVAEILADLVLRKVRAQKLIQPAVTLVDHGTPRIAVNRVRNFLADQLQELLRDEVAVVAASSMERREGPDYDFNEPLLENLLGSEGFDREVILSLLFMSPGRHAGPGGDIAEICRACEERHPQLRTHMAELFATHPMVLPLLARRFWQGVESRPIRGEVEPPVAGEERRG